MTSLPTEPQPLPIQKLFFDADLSVIIFDAEVSVVKVGRRDAEDDHVEERHRALADRVH